MADDIYAGNAELPIVTVFGAGIAGLTTAHELVERGFRVQVVEPTAHAFSEYQCAVGGLAANQFTRVRAPISVLHPTLMPRGGLEAAYAEKNLAHALAFRDWRSLEQTAPRHTLLERIRFDKHRHGGGPPPEDFEAVEPTPLDHAKWDKFGVIPEDWQDYWDTHGVGNRDKLAAVFKQLRTAVRQYQALYFPALAEQRALGKPNILFRNYTRVCEAATDDERERVARTFVTRETLLVRIVGYTDADGLPEVNRKIGRDWANKVYDALLALNEQAPPSLRIPDLDLHLEIVARGSGGADYDDSDPAERLAANRVEFETVEQVIPGEHGFRFFPGFYRHLFDTMRRTPIMDERGISRGTAFDQLVATPRPLLALDDGLHEFDLWHMRSMRQFNKLMDFTRKQLGFTTRDMVGIQFKLLKYLSSGPARRVAEAEPVNMIDYLDGGPEKKLSKACLDFLEAAPRALAAMSATESDARTQYNITAQLMDPGAPDPRTLNGPTTPVWLEPWKSYLKTQGAQFFTGRIEGLKVINGQLVPIATAPIGLKGQFDRPIPEDPRITFREPHESGVDLDQHRFVLAMQYQVVSGLAWQAYDIAKGLNASFEGPLRQMLAFDDLCGRRNFGDATARAPQRDPATGKENFSYPTRTISGLQYFFPQQYRIGQSNVFFVTQPWGLTSISQYAFWRDQVRPVGQFLGQISVDVGDWHAFYPQTDGSAGGPHGHPGWHCSAYEVAKYTWSQIEASMSADYAAVVSKPRYFHIDQNLVFAEFQEDEANGPGRLMVAAARANALIRAPNQLDPTAPVSLEKDRTCLIRFQVGAGDLEIMAETRTQEGDTNTSIRDRLLEQVSKNALGIALAEPASDALQGDGDLVVSPIVQLDAKALPSVLISVLGSSAALFIVALADRRFEFTASGKEPSALADDICARLTNRAVDLVRAERAGEAAVRVTVLPSNDGPISLGVLNIDGMIELAGAPILNLKVKNLQFVAPKTGYALLRNNYQYQINIVDQWRARPGLWRGAASEIPGKFSDLSATFGVTAPEIYYAHPRSCPLLRNWTCAGTYMATYTRMTTMEAANESGRHAVAAILYGLLEEAVARNDRHQMQLAGDFPQIWNIEDCEPEDFKYFKEVDDALMKAGLPHLFDILSVSSLVDAFLSGDHSSGKLLEPLKQLLQSYHPLIAMAPKLVSSLNELFAKIIRPAT